MVCVSISSLEISLYCPVYSHGFLFLKIVFSFALDRPVDQIVRRKNLSQRALRGRARARLTGALSKGGKVRGVVTNVYLWKTLGKPKETGQNENSKFGSCIYA